MNYRPPVVNPVTLFQSPPGSGGNDGAMPLSYDMRWQYFTNLTPDQIGWFKAQPEWATFMAAQQADPSRTSIPAPIPTPHK